MYYINITWLEPEGSNICQFSYHLMVKSENTNYLTNHTTNETSYKLTNLQPCISYIVTITVLYNNFEYGEVSNNVSTTEAGNVYMYIST